MKELLKKVRRLEIKVRRMVESTFAGEYQSAFKGQGLEFDEVRPYQYGDDIRSVDWNVSARNGSLFIKKFREEREQTLFVLFDVSGSEEVGPGTENKKLIGTEIAAILAFSALKNNDKMGLATFSDQIESYFKPARGRKHVLKIIRELLVHTPQHSQTNITSALEFATHTLPRRSILILISDFLDQEYEKALRRIALQHEVIAIRLFHPNEVFQSGVGIVPMMDIEHHQTRWINTGDIGYRKQLSDAFEQQTAHLPHFCQIHRIGYLSINTQEDYFPVLDQFFKRRNRKK